MSIFDAVFSRYQDTGTALLGVNPVGSETTTTTKKEYTVRNITQTEGGFQAGVGQGIGAGFAAAGEGYGQAYSQIGGGIGQNIIPIGLLVIGGMILAKKL